MLINFPPHRLPSDPLSAKWGDVRVALQSDPLKLVLSRESDEVVIQGAGPIRVLVRADGTVAGCQLCFASPAGEAFYGFGERFNALDQRGSVLDNHVYGQYTSQGKRSYIPVPFFISSRAYGFWLKTERQAEFDLAATEPDQWMLTGHTEEDSGLEMKFFLQEHPLSIVQAFTDLVGKPCLPPPWVFGLWMSSNDWNSQAEMMRQVSLAKQFEIPATVMVIEAWSDESNFYIWNDSKYLLNPPALSYNLHDFDFPGSGRWPHPKAMIDDLHAAGLKVVLWQIPVMKCGNPAEHLDETQKDADQEFAIRNHFVVQKADGTPHRIRISFTLVRKQPGFRFFKSRGCRLVV